MSNEPDACASHHFIIFKRASPLALVNTGFLPTYGPINGVRTSEARQTTAESLSARERSGGQIIKASSLYDLRMLFWSFCSFLKVNASHHRCFRRKTSKWLLLLLCLTLLEFSSTSPVKFKTSLHVALLLSPRANSLLLCINNDSYPIPENHHLSRHSSKWKALIPLHKETQTRGPPCMMTCLHHYV